MKTKTLLLPTDSEQRILNDVQVRPIKAEEQKRCDELLEAHHYLGSLRAVGERMYYVATTSSGEWLAILVFCAAAKHLRHRDRWIGWNDYQRRSRLKFIVNNSRFLILPGRHIPNLASGVLRLTLDRISSDWEVCYGHKVLLVETFVDTYYCSGTIYRASGWVELGDTSGFGRVSRDYYVKHDRPKRLFVKELYSGARDDLRGDYLSGELVVEERGVGDAIKCGVKEFEVRAFVEYFKRVKDFRGRIGRYPVWSLLGIVGLAHFCGAGGSQKEIAMFARCLSERQRRGLGIRRDKRSGKYPVPSQSTFCRLLRGVKPDDVEKAILLFQSDVRGGGDKDDVIAIDGKELRHSKGNGILTAVRGRSQYYLGSVGIRGKLGEVSAARELIDKVGDISGQVVMLDALHTNDDTARKIVEEAGADYILPVKRNRIGMMRTLDMLFKAVSDKFFLVEEEENRGRLEVRKIRTLEVSGENVCFPYVSQAGEVRRKIGGYDSEKVYLISSREISRMDSRSFLRYQRDYWGIEGIMHQMLDVSSHEDRCRVRDGGGSLILGMFRRLVISIFFEWRKVGGDKRRRKTLRDFFYEMRLKNYRKGYLLICGKDARGVLLL